MYHLDVNLATLKKCLDFPHFFYAKKRNKQQSFNPDKNGSLAATKASILITATYRHDIRRKAQRESLLICQRLQRLSRRSRLYCSNEASHNSMGWRKAKPYDN